MSASTSPVMDPNAIIPSPPSSICSSTTAESLRSAPKSQTTHNSSRRASKSSLAAATQLPFPEIRRIMGYAQEELEAVSFTVLENADPDLLEAKEIDCADGVELNWACRQLPPHCPDSMGETLNDWLPDIRHAVVHRYRFTALAACKTMHEAAVFAQTMGYEALGRRFEDITREMDWCHVEMDQRSIGPHNDLQVQEDLKKLISGRLQGVLKACRKERGWEVQDGWKISAEVLDYTFDRKLEENSWADPRAWGQDRNRNYQPGSASRSPPSPVRLSSVVDKVDSWRSSSTSSGVSPSESTSGKSASGSEDMPSVQNGVQSPRTRLSPGGEEGNFWRASTSGKSTSNSSERPMAQNNLKFPAAWLSSSIGPSTSASGNSSSSESTPSKAALKSSEKSPAQNVSKAYVPPGKRTGSASSWTKKK